MGLGEESGEAGSAMMRCGCFELEVFLSFGWAGKMDATQFSSRSTIYTRIKWIGVVLAQTS